MDYNEMNIRKLKSFAVLSCGDLLEADTPQSKLPYAPSNTALFGTRACRRGTEHGTLKHLQLSSLGSAITSLKSQMSNDSLQPGTSPLSDTLSL